MHPLKCTFWGYYISALRGCCALKFLHTLEIDQGLLAHTRRGTGVPPKNRENLKLALKFSVLESITSGIHGSIFTKLFYATCHYCERNFVFLKMILHSDLQRRAASRLALPCTSSCFCFILRFDRWVSITRHESDANELSWLTNITTAIRHF